MDQVPADRMAPVLVADLQGVGVVLEEEMVFAAVKHAAVGIVVEAAPRGEVELTAERFAVERVATPEFVRRLDGGQCLGILGQEVDLQGDGLAFPRLHVHGCPPVRLRIGQLDAVTHDRPAPGLQGDQSLGGAVFDGNGEVLAGDRDFAAGRRHPRRPLRRLDNLVHVQVAPSAGGLVDDADHRLFACELPHLPIIGLQPLRAAGSVQGVWAGGGAHDLAIHFQQEGGFFGIFSAPDEEAEIGSFQSERRGGEGTGGAVPLAEGVDEAAALEAGDFLLAGQSALGRGGAERLSLGLPSPVAVTLKVSHEQIRRICRDDPRNRTKKKGNRYGE